MQCQRFVLKKIKNECVGDCDETSSDCEVRGDAELQWVGSQFKYILV